MQDPWARVLWSYAQLREVDRIDALLREGERMDLMMKFAVAINLGLTGEKTAVEAMREDFERRLSAREEPIGPSEKYAGLLREQEDAWAGYEEGAIRVVPLPPEPPIFGVVQ